jgi:hypothetical protein
VVKLIPTCKGGGNRRLTGVKKVTLLQPKTTCLPKQNFPKPPKTSISKDKIDLKTNHLCDIIINVKNKSYNFIQTNYMFISKLHNTQFKFSDKEASSYENPLHQKDGEKVTNATVFRTESGKVQDSMIKIRNQEKAILDSTTKNKENIITIGLIELPTAFEKTSLFTLDNKSGLYLQKDCDLADSKQGMYKKNTPDCILSEMYAGKSDEQIAKSNEQYLELVRLYYPHALPVEFTGDYSTFNEKDFDQFQKYGELRKAVQQKYVNRE